MRVFTRTTGGKALTKAQFFKVFNPCFEKAMTIEHAQAGFRGTGLFPVNVKAIDPAAFAPSKTTVRPLDTDSAVSVVPLPPPEPVNTDVTHSDQMLTEVHPVSCVAISLWYNLSSLSVNLGLR